MGVWSPPAVRVGRSDYTKLMKMQSYNCVGCLVLMQVVSLWLFLSTENWGSLWTLLAEEFSRSRVG